VKVSTFACGSQLMKTFAWLQDVGVLRGEVATRRLDTAACDQADCERAQIFSHEGLPLESFA
jgi:hypothetical protein